MAEYEYTTMTATGTTSDQVVWYTWSSATGTTSNNTLVWCSWNDTGTPTTSTFVSNCNYMPLSAEAEAARVARDNERQAAIREAAKRAYDLLDAQLSADQRAQYKKHRHFDVISQGRRRYRIEYGKHGNVRLLDDNGRRVRTYCAAPVGDVPNEDAMLVQKLMLECQEDDFLRVANAS